jgi:hypothetical protein
LDTYILAVSGGQVSGPKPLRKIERKWALVMLWLQRRDRGELRDIQESELFNDGGDDGARQVSN